MRKFGIYDSHDGLWIGDQAGPLVYEDEDVARVAAMIVDRSLHQRMGRCRALPFTPRPVKVRDSKPVLTDPVTALTQLEEGL